VPWPERVAVLGAGVMGVQIAALLVAAGRRVQLFDLADPSDSVSGARSGIKRGLSARPPVFYAPEMADQIELRSFDDLSALADADWVIEAVVEELSIKRELLARVEAEGLGHAVVSSNTSGLSMAQLAAGRSADFSRRFLGVHFFNPPRHMRLVEVIPTAVTDRAAVEQVTDFLQGTLGKGVVVARDTPNFIANRLGVFAILSMLHLMEREALSVPLVDALSGPLMGRPKSATLRLCDIIGLDTLARVSQTAYDALVDDPWRSVFSLPSGVERMLNSGLLGAKSGGGFYRKTAEGIYVLNMDTLEYEVGESPTLDGLAEQKGRPHDLVRALWDKGGRWGELGRAHLKQVLLYAAWHGNQIAREAADIDRAMRWGFNWDLGPFQLGDWVGWEHGIEGEPRVPQQITDMQARGHKTFYDGSAETASGDRLQVDASFIARKSAIYENEEAYVCPLPQGAVALVFCGKVNTLGRGVIQAVRWIMDEADATGLMLCGLPPHFSAGANLQYIRGLEGGDLADFLVDFQQAVESVRRAPFPVVAALSGLCLGGGCEFALAADRRIVMAEVRMGLVEAGVGLLPAGGGIAHMARTLCGKNLCAGHQVIAAGVMCDNAFEARSRGLLGEEDVILFSQAHLLPAAVEELCSQMESWKERPAEGLIPAVEAEVREAMDQWIADQVEEGCFTAHDAFVGRVLTGVLCGDPEGETARRNEDVLALERQAFIRLYESERTKLRIDHMLKTGKRLKN
jgi:3-hydroxyacyl-CoA dehydrogenase